MRNSTGALKETRNGGWLHILVGRDQRIQRPQRPAPPPPRLIAPAFRLHAVYSALLDRLTLSAGHNEHLTEARRLSPETIVRAGYATVPAWRDGQWIAEDLAKEFDLTFVPGFFREDDLWHLCRAGTSGVYIPLRDAQGRISALQIRRDTTETDKRYLLVSSAKLPAGASSGVPFHFARTWLVQDALLITEGGLKAEVIAEQINQPVMGLVGVAAFSSRIGWQLRTWFPSLRRIAIAFDHDQSELAAAAVAHQLQRLETALQAAQLETERLEWPVEYKGLDDCLLAKGRHD